MVGVKPRLKDPLQNDTFHLQTVRCTQQVYNPRTGRREIYTVDLPLTLSMVDSLHGFATESFMCDASDTRVYYTTTGWKRYDTIPPAWNWRLGERPFPLTLLGLNDTTAVMCIAGGNRTYFCRYLPTTGWERFYVDTGLIPVRPYFVNDTHGYLAGNMLTKYGGASRYNVIYRTTDKGQSWIKVFQELSFGMISQITFRDNYGLVVGSNTLIYETYDGGQTWHIVPFHRWRYNVEHRTDATLSSALFLYNCTRRFYTLLCHCQ